MVSLEEAVRRILTTVSHLSSEEELVGRAAGRYIDSDVNSPINLPGFDNSAMDGYALRSADLAEASEEKPTGLKCVGEIPAGSASDVFVKPGECARIFTGSPLPAGVDAVVMQEDTQKSSDSSDILVLERVRPWENIRFAGEDLKQGSVIAKSGEQIRSGHIALMAACGLESVTVRRRPRVGILATGSELVESGKALAPGQIYESNRTLLSHLVQNAGGSPTRYPIVKDNLDQTCAALATAFSECDVVLTSGGVSVGDHDYVKSALEKLGGTVDFWKVAIRPGKPFVHGQLNGNHFFGLPGNPISTFVTFLLLVRPMLVRMQGGLDFALSTSRGVLAEDMANRGNRRHFARVVLASDGTVISAGLQASHALSSLGLANGLLELPPETSWEAGREVNILRIDG